MASDKLAEPVGHTPSQIRLIAQQRTLPAHQGPNGRQWLLYRDELIGWIRAQRVVPED